MTANSMISGLPIEGDSYLKRVSGGVMADGFNSFLAGVFNSFPNSIFAQNNGIITTDWSSQSLCGLLYCCNACTFGLVPYCRGCFFINARSVLGGATLLMFGTVAAAGIRIVSSQEIGRKENVGISGQPFSWLGSRINAGRTATSP